MRRLFEGYGRRFESKGQIKTQKPDLSVGPCDKPGNFLRSHTLARAVPSGLRGLTSVFGMGTGGSPSLWSPRNWLLVLGCWLLAVLYRASGQQLTTKNQQLTFEH